MWRSFFVTICFSILVFTYLKYHGALAGLWWTENLPSKFEGLSIYRIFLACVWLKSHPNTSLNKLTERYWIEISKYKPEVSQIRLTIYNNIFVNGSLWKVSRFESRDLLIDGITSTYYKKRNYACCANLLWLRYINKQIFEWCSGLSFKKNWNNIK